MSLAVSTVVMVFVRSVSTHVKVIGMRTLGKLLVIAGWMGKIATPPGPFVMMTDPSSVVPSRDTDGLPQTALKTSLHPVMSCGTPFSSTVTWRVRESPRDIQRSAISTGFFGHCLFLFIGSSLFLQPTEASW